MVRVTITPEGMFAYYRKSGYALFTPQIKSRTWTRPLFAQISVTERCNLNCPFCYLNPSPEKGRMWHVEELMELVKFLDSWKVLGVAYGGGEPFTHPDLSEIVRRTWKETGLDVSVTTNGFAASKRQIQQIEGYAGEVRVSIRSLENCLVLERFLSKKFDLGVNLLLMKGNTPLLEEIIRKCVEMGVRDFLVNSFLAVGRGIQHREWEPEEEDYLHIGKNLEKSRNEATIKISGRMATALKRLTSLKFIPFEDEKRGRVIAITVDRKVKPSSLSEESYPFNKPEEIATIFEKKIASQRLTSNIGGVSTMFKFLRDQEYRGG